MIEALKKSIAVVCIYVFLTVVLYRNVSVIGVAGFFSGAFLAEMIFSNLHKQ